MKTLDLFEIFSVTHLKVLHMCDESSGCTLNTESSVCAAWCRHNTCDRRCRSHLINSDHESVTSAIGLVWDVYNQWTMYSAELLHIWLWGLQKTLVSLGGFTFVVEKSAVGTEVPLVVPGQVPRHSRSHTAAFTPNAGHAHLHNNVTKQQAWGYRRVHTGDSKTKKLSTLDSMMAFFTFNISETKQGDFHK